MTLARACGLAALVALAGCARQHALHGGTFIIVQQREPRALNPELENGVNSQEWGALLFSYLVTWNNKGQMIGDVATVVPSDANGGVSRDGLTITYHLRHDVRFADGAPLTAADCVYTIQAVLNPRNNIQSRYGYDRIITARATDPFTLVLRLREPFAPIVSIVLASEDFPILPRHALARYADFNQIPFDSMPTGSGPYIARRWVRGDRVELAANPRYFRGRPRIDRLVIRFVPNANTAIDELSTGEANAFFDDLDTNDYPALRAVAGVRTILTPLNEVGALIFNAQEGATRDDRVRQALAQAIDMRRLVGFAYRGSQQAHDTGRGLFQWAYDPRAYPDVPYAPARAKQLLDEAGWRMGADGLRHKGGETLDLQLAIQAAILGDEALAAAIKQQELAVGADVTLKAYDVNTFIAPPEEGGPIYAGRFQMALYPFENGNDPDPTDQFACSRVPPNGYNKSRFCEPALDALMATALRTYDAAQRRALYIRVQRILARQLPIEIIFQTREIDAFDERLHGESVSPNGPFWNVWAWRLEPQ